MLDRTKRMSRCGFLVLGALAGSVGSGLQAQGLLVLPASDPVGIARSGVGVAFGRSLEASGQNPALLVTVPEAVSGYLAGGMEFQSSQATLFSNQITHFSTDRNRPLPALGAAWKVHPRFALGLRLDTPALRHGELPIESSVRFHGEALDLKAQRLSLQAAWVLAEQVSVGLAAGIVQVDYASAVTLRAAVPEAPEAPIGVANPSMGLLERAYVQEGKATVPSFSAGLRWAINPRWTLGLAAHAPIRGNLALSARDGARSTRFYSNDGLGSSPLDGIEAKAAVLLAASQVRSGTDRFEIPGRATLGLRQRVNPLFTWELDVSYVAASRLSLPSQPSLQTPQGLVEAQGPASPVYKNGVAFGLAGELMLGKRWTARLGLALDPALRADHDVEPLLGGARTAAFSAGFGFRVFGGEIALGFQFRQARDTDTPLLDGVWSVYGFRQTGTPIRVENMGHVFSLGFRKAF